MRERENTPWICLYMYTTFLQIILLCCVVYVFLYDETEMQTTKSIFIDELKNSTELVRLTDYF